MKNKVFLGTRLLLGLLFLVFGSNGLMMIFTGNGFLPMPPPSPAMGTIMSGFFGAVYLMPLVKGLQVLSALFLLSNRYVNLALVFLAPIVVNILGIHIFVDPSGLPVALFIAVLLGVQIYARWGSFKPLIACK